MSELTADDWRCLSALRDRFLSDASRAYWTPRALTLYDATFAQRIGWKWNGVFRILEQAGWKPTATRLLDWGCGSGIASRAVADWTGIRHIQVFDQSPEAMDFACTRLRETGRTAAPWRGGAMPAGTLLVVSHVAGELTPDEWTHFIRFAAAADEILWLEPGSHAISRRLSAARDEVQNRGHHLVAPCTHAQPCPVLTQEQDWCHFFAEPPNAIFQSAFWKEFSVTLGIDLRALPFSFFASSRTESRHWPAGAERVIGSPRPLKARCELLCCGARGLTLRTLQKRDAPHLVRAFSRKPPCAAFRWTPDPVRADRILGGGEVTLK